MPPIKKSYHPFSHQQTVWAALIYLCLLAILASSITFSRELIGNNIDNWIFYWNDWWLRTALTQGHSPLFTDRLFAPHGTSLILHSFSFLSSLLAWVPAQLIGPIAAHNLILLFGLWLGGLGMFALVRTSSSGFAGAFIAGLIYTFAPYHLTQALAHDHLGSIHWWPWFLLALSLNWQTGKLRYALWAGLLAALTLWSGLQLALMLVMLTAFYWLVSWYQGEWDWHTWPHLLITGLVAALLCAPYLVPLLAQRESMLAATEIFQEGSSKQTDLLAYIVPPVYQPWWGHWFARYSGEFIVNQVFIPFLGFSPLLLALWGAIRSTLVRIWLLGMCGWMLLALGSLLRAGGHLTQWPLPFHWLSQIFPLSTLRSPDRFNLLVLFSLAFLVGLTINELIKRRVAFWATLLSLMVMAEFLIWPLPAWQPPSGSPILETLAQGSSDEAIFDYPAGYDNSKFWLYYQTIHKRPIVEGHVSRFNAHTYRFFAFSPLAQALYPPEELASIGISAPGQAISPPTTDTFLEQGIRYIMHHREYSDEQEAAHLYNILPYAPIYKDDVIELFDLTNPEPFSIEPAQGVQEAQFVFGDVVALQSASWQRVSSELRLQLTWTAVTPPTESFKVFVHLLNAQGILVRQYDAVPCRWQCPTETWQSGAEILDETALELYGLPAGEYRILIGLYHAESGERLLAEDNSTFFALPGIKVVK